MYKLACEMKVATYFQLKNRRRKKHFDSFFIRVTGEVLISVLKMLPDLIFSLTVRTNIYIAYDFLQGKNKCD